MVFSGFTAPPEAVRSEASWVSLASVEPAFLSSVCVLSFSELAGFFFFFFSHAHKQVSTLRPGVV